MDTELFAQIHKRLCPDERIHILSLPEVALANSSLVSRLLPFHTSFVHVTTPVGLLDLAQYVVAGRTFSFRLGPVLELMLPRSVLDRVEVVSWRGLSYRAGPIELAFIPKAIAYRRRPDALPRHHVEDLRRLAPLVDLAFLTELARFRGLRLFGRPLPRRLDPFVTLPDVVRDIAGDTAA